ncbi:MAG: DUF4956 domain-containing protein [Oscillospiraceae bacterium]|jgi:uncharacterized membrane protein YhiD involved in acid resistance|nr:DUF4956 domain-containing protein [Oscillospiraceae bacterium]
MLTMSFVSDVRSIIEDSFELAQTHVNLSPAKLLAALGTAAVCGLVIYLVYRFFYRGIVFSENYNILLVLVTVVTAMIINTIAVNIVLSLGMVGALSIVRFRSAVKDPLDIGFLFWGIAAGVTAGAGLYPTALLGTAFIAALYILLTFLKKEKKSYLLIIKYAQSAEEGVNTLLKSTRYKLKNKTRAGESVELTVEVKVKRNNAEVVAKYNEVSGVETVTLLEYSGEYMN